MDLRIDDLQEIQGTLDARIFELHDTTRAKTRNDRVLALLVELGELANETRCFKYWSLRGPSEDEVVFEEYSDVLHFVLSLGIDIEFSESTISYEPTDMPLNDLFHKSFAAVHAFTTENTVSTYRTLFQSILTLAHTLGMDNEAIRTRYLSKNAKNHTRQDNNY